MNRIKIEGSSNIAEIGYNGETMTLEVKFLSSMIYQYWPITRTGWESLMKAESKGKYFAKHIRNNSQINFKMVDGMQSEK